MTGIRTLRALIRGGNWNNSVNAGGWTVNGNNSPRNANSNIGFRCCSKPPKWADTRRSRLVRQPRERLGPIPCPQAGPKITARRGLVARCANAPVEHSFLEQVL